MHPLNRRFSSHDGTVNTAQIGLGRVRKGKSDPCHQRADLVGLAVSDLDDQHAAGREQRGGLRRIAR